jgi:hypothetical protein
LHRSASSSSNTTGQGQGVVDLFEEATIMFVNIVNLDTITANLYPNMIQQKRNENDNEVLLTKTRDEADTFNFYNEIFTQFDEATIAFGLEKIKTVSLTFIVQVFIFY